MPRRRSARSSSHRSPNLLQRFVSYLVLIAVLLGGLFGVFWLLGDTFFPLKTDQNVLFIHSSLDGGEGQIIISHFSVTEGKLVMIPVDGQAKVEVLGGYGSYAVAKVYPLLKMDKKDPQFIKAAFSWALGVDIDQVVILEKPLVTISQEELAAALRAQIFHQGLHLGKANQLAQLYFFAKNVPVEQVTTTSETVELTHLSAKLHQASHQDCSIAIINTTQVPKLASRMSTIFEQSELLVIRVDDSTSGIETSTVNYDATQAACAAIGDRIQTVFPSPLAVVNNSADRQESRADMVITIGKDLGDLFVR